MREFKFTNKRRESVCFDEVLLNNIENGDGVTPFAQRVTSMCVGDRKKLLGNYLTLLQYAESFIYHNPALKEENGFKLTLLVLPWKKWNLMEGRWRISEVLFRCLEEDGHGILYPGSASEAAGCQPGCDDVSHQPCTD